LSLGSASLCRGKVTGEPVSPLSFRTVSLRADRGELLVQLPDRLDVAPRLQVQTEPAHVLEIGRDLLAVRQRQRFRADAAGFVDLALAAWAMVGAASSRCLVLTHLGMERPKRRLENLPGVSLACRAGHQLGGVPACVLRDLDVEETRLDR
jgi:hypothetical protein